jgi:hypothetical protein
MPTKKPRAKPSRADLDHPYLASKLAKLQGVHERTEKLMDKLYQEILETEEKRPGRVPVRARNPGPRTEEEKRKAFRARRLSPKPKAEPEFFTLGEAAKYLQFKSEKFVLRLINAGKFDDPKKLVIDGKKRWVIKRVDLNRYRHIEGAWHIEDAWLWRQIGPVPTLDEAKGQRLGHVFVYGDPPIHAPIYSLTVSIEEFWRFVCRRRKTQHDYEAVKAEIRARLPGKPTNFRVRYRFNRKEADRFLTRIVKTVYPLRYGEEWSRHQTISLQYDALEHLKKTVLPSLRNADWDLISYLRLSVKNFYKDRYRKNQRRATPLSQRDDQDLPEDAADFQNWSNRDRGQLDDNLLSQLDDQDLQDLQDLQDSDLTELSKRTDSERILIFKERLRKLKK